MYLYIQLFLNCILSLNNKREGESVASTGYITQTQEYSDDQRASFTRSNISSTVLSLIQNDTLQDNVWRNDFISTSILFYTTNVYTFAKSTSTYSNLVEAPRNVWLEVLQFLYQSTHVQRKETVILPNLWNTSFVTVI